MNIDVIVSWPNNCDFPLWRQFIRENRDRFNEVFIVFTQTHQQPDYSEFVIQAMYEDRITFLLAPPPSSPTEDWRNLAVNEALKKSKAEWVWFTEQDFFIEPLFWSLADNYSKQSNSFDIFAVYDDTRMHPCCILAKRSIVDQTSKNFGIVPDISDHFSIFQSQVEESCKIYKLMQSDYFHFNGLSSNCTLLQNGLEPNWRPEEFAKYLDDCLNSTVPLDPRFVEFADKYLMSE